MKRKTATICFECGDQPVALSMRDGDIVSARGPHFDKGKGFSDLLAGNVKNLTTLDGEDSNPGHSIESAMELILFELAAGRDVSLGSALDHVRKTGKLPADVLKTASAEYEAMKTARQQIILLEQGATIIGRASSATVRIEDPTVSRQHAQITIEGNSAQLSNLSASNGTYLNRDQITTEQLNEQDVITIGEAMFRFFWSDCGRGILFKFKEDSFGIEDQTTFMIPR